MAEKVCCALCEETIAPNTPCWLIEVSSEDGTDVQVFACERCKGELEEVLEA